MKERYLANENFPAGVVRWLIANGDDVVHAAQVLVGEPDSIILRTALDQDRVLLTFDQDFGELVFRHNQPPSPGIVLFRLHQLPPNDLEFGVQAFFANSPELRGFFTVVSPGQYRQTALPSIPPG